MPEIVIRIDCPPGVTVRVEGVSGLATACKCSSGKGGPRGESAPPRAPSGARGEGDGSASEKQRRMIYAKAKAADVALPDLLATVGLEHLDDAGWKDINALVEVLDSGARPPEAAPGAPPQDDTEIPF